MCSAKSHVRFTHERRHVEPDVSFGVKYVRSYSESRLWMAVEESPLWASISRPRGALQNKEAADRGDPSITLAIMHALMS
jgi:hypothetical protein